MYSLLQDRRIIRRAILEKRRLRRASFDFDFDFTENQHHLRAKRALADVEFFPSDDEDGYIESSGDDVEYLPDEEIVDIKQPSGDFGEFCLQ